MPTFVLPKELIQPLTNEEETLLFDLREDVYLTMDVEKELATIEDTKGNFMKEANFLAAKGLYEKYRLSYARENTQKYMINTTDKKIKWDKEHPLSAQEKKELMSCLYDVGRTKSIGYLSIYVLERCVVGVEDMLKYARENHLGYRVYETNKGHIKGYVYLYDEKMLQAVLMEEQEALNEANVPINTVESYIDFIQRFTISQEEHPEAYRAIGRTYNDDRFR